MKLIVTILSLIGAGLLFIELPEKEISQAFCQPSLQNWFGCSPLGEDILALTFWGLFKTAAVAICGRLLALLLSVVGFFLAYMHVGFYQVVSRLAETFMTIPSLLLALALGFFMGAGFFAVVISVAISEWALNQKWQLGRLNEFKRFSFIEASDTFGANKVFKFKFHFLPFLKKDLFLLFFIYFPTTILTVTSLEFLGLSSADNMPGLGYQVAAYKDFVFLHPHMSLPSIAVSIGLVFFSLYLKRKMAETETKVPS